MASAFAKLKSENAATDLESFANHAGRSSINTDDVLLLTRRNEGLESIIKAEVEKLKKAKDTKNGGS